MQDSDLENRGSSSFAPPQPHSLTVLLQLGNQGVAVFHHIRILLVLVIGTSGLDCPLHPVNCATNPTTSDELGQIPVQEVHADAKCLCHRRQSDHSVRLQE